MPEASNRALFLVVPGKMAILAIKLLGNDLERAKDANQRRSHEFSSHLRIFEIGRAALWSTDKCRGDIEMSRLLLDHHVMSLLYIGVFDNDFGIRERSRHEAD